MPSVQHLLSRAVTLLIALALVIASLGVVSPAPAHGSTPSPTETPAETSAPQESTDPVEEADPTDEPTPGATPDATASPEPTSSPDPTPDPVGPPTPTPSGESSTRQFRGHDLGVAGLETDATLGGTVTKAGGIPVEGVEISVHSQDDGSITQAETDAAGEWSLSYLSAGTYLVEFVNTGAENLAPEWWDDATDEYSATPITLEAGDIVDDIDAVLSAGASISGEVTGDSGAIEGIEVWVYDAAFDFVGKTVTGADGAWTLGSLAEGDHYVWFADWSNSEGYVDEWWDGQSSYVDATPVSVAHQQQVTGIDAYLEIGATLTGTVSADGAGLGGVAISIYGQDDGEYEPTSWTTSNPDGTWSADGLPPGSYAIEFVDNNAEPYASQWWDGQTARVTADLIEIDAAEIYSGFDVELQPGAEVSGVVTGEGGVPLADVRVSVHGPGSGAVVAEGITNSAGEYTVGGLNAGTYTLSFEPHEWGESAAYIGEWWDDQDSLDSATEFTLAVGATTTKNASLVRGAEISGFVRSSASGNPALEGWSVSAFNASGDEVGWTESQADGSYVLGNLRAGTYTVRFTAPIGDSSSLWRQVYWGGSSSRSAATPITLSGGQVLTGRNVVVPAGRSISGTVTYLDGTPAAGLSIWAESRFGSWGVSETDESGDYVLRGLAPGSYLLSFPSPHGYPVYYPGGATEPGDADLVQIFTSSVTFDMVMPVAPPASGSISGRVVTSESEPVPYAWVVLIDASTGDDVGWAETDDEGYFSVDQLGEGSYLLHASGFDAPATWWDGAALQGAADPIALAADQQRDLGDVQLLVGGSISGSVTNAEGDPLAGVAVTVYDADGRQIAAVSTGSDGEYVILGVTPGSHTLAFAADWDSPYLDEWWNDAASQDEASPVVVTSGGSVTGLETELALGDTLQGTHPLTTGRIELYDAVGWPVDTVFVEPGTTEYEFVGLAAGSYRLVAVPSFGWQPAVASATANLPGGGETTVKNLTTGGVGTVSGSVTDTAGDGIDNATVMAWRSGTTGGVAVLEEAVTDSDGEYTLGALLPGSYTVGFSDHASAFGAATPTEFAEYGGIFLDLEFYEDAPAASGATPVVVTAGSATTGVDAVLTDKGAQSFAPGTPTISVPAGGPKVGQTLTASRGTWAPTPTSTSYQWNRNGVPIPGKTSSTYRLVAADAGSQITVTVTGAKAGYTTATVTSAPTAIVAGGVISPAPIPTISGSAVVGAELTATPGTWGPGSIALAYQWKRDGATIPGATGSTYEIANADAGSKITVTVTGSRSGFASVAKTSLPTALVTGGVFETAATTITGTPTVGSKLTAVRGVWSPVPTTVTYRWYRNGVLIAGQAASSYTLVTADAGKSITASVTGSRAGVALAATETSAPTAMVTGGVFSSAAAPKITGLAVNGATLTATVAPWSPVAGFAFQWKRNGIAVGGATDATYELGESDVGAKITVTVTGSLRGFTKSVTSAATTTVLDVFDEGEPVIVGDTLAGSVLLADRRIWPDAPSKFTYQWLRNGAAISGATAMTYATTATDIGKVISVRITASKTGFAPSVVTTEPTDPIVGREFTAAPTPTITVPAAGAVVGQTLKAVPGTWSPAATLKYQWLRDGVPISKATLSTYKLVSADAGAEISVQVTGSKTLYATTVRVSGETAMVTGGVFVAAVPKITGVAALGNTLTAVPGTWKPATEFGFEWKRNGVTIEGSHDPTYEVQAADLGARITVTVWGGRPGFVDKSVTSLPTAVVLDSLDAATPSVSGALEAGSVLTANPGVWPDAPSKFTYQWLRNGAVISGATATTYATTATDIGKVISVRVTASKAGFAPSVVTSAGVEIVGRVFTSAPVPTITVPAAGAKIGQTLRAVPGAWSPSATLTYQWLREGVPISGAKSPTYVLVSADAGSQISVEVTGKRSLYATTVRASAPTAVVTGGTFTAAPTPTIVVPAAGAKVGQTLKAVPGVWSPAPTLSYQWLRDGVPISGAKSSAYLLVAADAGRAISVRVTATKATYVTSVKTSAPVGKVVGTAFPLAIGAVGDFVVGDTVEPGIYVTLGTPSACYWERLSALDGDPTSIIESDSGAGPWTVEILETDYAFSSFGCNGWIKLSDVAS